MSAWSGKFVIGLTGNIATGKSLVRQMLETLGAFGIDADALAHKALLPESTGYDLVINAFGKNVLKSDGHINRKSLATIVFSDPDALVDLETIIHPLVDSEINQMILSSEKDVFVIEAIKLIESGLYNKCDTLWVTSSSLGNQVKRLMRTRNFSKEEAIFRINAQPAQEEKLLLANIVIQNDGSLEDTWNQVHAAWEKTLPNTAALVNIQEMPADFDLDVIEIKKE